MKEYENYNFNNKSKDSRFLLFWKKISKYNLEAVLFFIFFAYPIILQVKDILLPGFKFGNIYNFILVIVIIALLFSIIKKIAISNKKEKEIEQERRAGSIVNQGKKSFNGMNIYFLLLAFIWIGFIVAPKGMNKLLSLPERNDWTMAIFVFVMGYSMLYVLLKDINQKKGIKEKVKFFSWKLLFFTFLLCFALILIPIILFVFLDTFGNGSVLMF